MIEYSKRLPSQVNSTSDKFYLLSIRRYSRIRDVVPAIQKASRSKSVKAKTALRSILALSLLLATVATSAQSDSLRARFSFNSDFRFRLEQDWNSRKPDGTFRDDRTRLRYRFRAGFKYQHNNWASVGARLRTGDPAKQQDPQLTLGEGFKEFGTLPFALEMTYFKAEHKGYTLWLGKNSFPFEKQNELFWSDNVFPEGAFLKKKFELKSGFLNAVGLSGGHFVMNARGKSLDLDSYLQGMQLSLEFLDKRLSFFPTLYLFRNIQNIPDGADTYLLDYSIFHVGGSAVLLKKPFINVEGDYYINLEDYGTNDSIPATLKNQKSGWVAALGCGTLKDKGDWHFKITYNYMQRYAAVDFLAQNDWARWDYASNNSPDGRLTNYHGAEVVAGYMLAKGLSLRVKYYLVEQIIPYGIATETGSRIRFDLDIKF